MRALFTTISITQSVTSCRILWSMQPSSNGPGVFSTYQDRSMDQFSHIKRNKPAMCHMYTLEHRRTIRPDQTAESKLRICYPLWNSVPSMPEQVWNCLSHFDTQEITPCSKVLLNTVITISDSYCAQRSQEFTLSLRILNGRSILDVSELVPGLPDSFMGRHIKYISNPTRKICSPVGIG